MLFNYNGITILCKSNRKLFQKHLILFFKYVALYYKKNQKNWKFILNNFLGKNIKTKNYHSKSVL